MIDKIWTEKPKEEIKQCYIIPNKYVGKSSKDKLIEIKKELKKDKTKVKKFTQLEHLQRVM